MFVEFRLCDYGTAETLYVLVESYSTLRLHQWVLLIILIVSDCVPIYFPPPKDASNPWSFSLLGLLSNVLSG